MTDRAEEPAGFYRGVLRLPLVRTEPGCWGYGIELVGQPGPTRQHFRGGDANVYELVTSGEAASNPE